MRPMRHGSPIVQTYASVRAYRFFLNRRGKTFDLAELEEATGWSPTSLRTYIAKRWQHFLARESGGIYRVLTFDFSEPQFLALHSQLSAIPVAQSKYDYD